MRIVKCKTKCIVVAALITVIIIVLAVHGVRRLGPYRRIISRDYAGTLSITPRKWSTSSPPIDTKLTTLGDFTIDGLNESEATGIVQNEGGLWSLWLRYPNYYVFISAPIRTDDRLQKEIADHGLCEAISAIGCVRPAKWWRVLLMSSDEYADHCFMLQVKRNLLGLQDLRQVTRADMCGLFGVADFSECLLFFGWWAVSDPKVTPGIVVEGLVGSQSSTDLHKVAILFDRNVTKAEAISCSEHFLSTIRLQTEVPSPEAWLQAVQSDIARNN